MNDRLNKRQRTPAGFIRILSVLAFAAIAWAGGLVWFGETIPDLVEDSETRTDAIVVLTGGPQRLRAGLGMLADGRARKLFVSGVYRGVDVSELLRIARQSPAEIECCIVLGYSADNTVGNAEETAAWMRAEGFASLRLVTANYHMRRSLIEFHHALPEATIIPHPVFLDSFHQEDWWRWPGTASLILSEYHKFLAAIVWRAIEGVAPVAIRPS
ncbi:MAG: YdcF family protein [Rhodospirillaceae bacterium]|nr:YdcF family protein [Rhodospirillaceae bacterium]